jgi:hypothetical protein
MMTRSSPSLFFIINSHASAGKISCDNCPFVFLTESYMRFTSLFTPIDGLAKEKDTHAIIFFEIQTNGLPHRSARGYSFN